MPNFRTAVEFTIRCNSSFCRTTERQRYLVAAGDVVPNPSLPPGWIVIEGLAFCDKHAIEIKIDEHVWLDQPAWREGVNQCKIDDRIVQPTFGTTLREMELYCKTCRRRWWTPAHKPADCPNGCANNWEVIDQHEREEREAGYIPKDEHINEYRRRYGLAPYPTKEAR